MKEQESEWISVSDFMASLVAVLVIFVVALMIKLVPPGLSKEMIEQQRIQREIIDVLKSFGSMSHAGTKSSKFFQIDTLNNSISFVNGAFDTGSPCLLQEALDTLVANRQKIKNLLETRLNVILTIEGHADNSPVIGTRGRPRYCGMRIYSYNDNVTLSLCRAEETRLLLTQDWADQRLSERVALLGYGATKPKEGIKNMSENRRVVFKFSLVERK